MILVYVFKFFFSYAHREKARIMPFSLNNTIWAFSYLIKHLLKAPILRLYNFFRLWVPHNLFNYSPTLGIFWLTSLQYYKLQCKWILIVYLVWIEKKYSFWLWMYTAKLISEKGLPGMEICISPHLKEHCTVHYTI